MALILYLLICAFTLVLTIKIVIKGLEFLYKYAFTLAFLILLFSLFL